MLKIVGHGLSTLKKNNWLEKKKSELSLKSNSHLPKKIFALMNAH